MCVVFGVDKAYLRFPRSPPWPSPETGQASARTVALAPPHGARWQTTVLQHAAMRSTYSLEGGSSLGGVIVSCAWVAASLEGGRSEGEISSRALRSEIDLLKLISCSSSTRTSHIFQTEVINLQQAPDRDLITLGGIKGHPHVTTLFSPRPSRTTQAVA